MRRRTEDPERLLATVLFTDIVGSTQLASELGDRGWRQLLDRHHAFVRKALKQHGGREVDTAGDGFFATFDRPGRAIRCAEDLVNGLSRMGIQIRAGIHMGEVELMGPKVGGIAVHIGSRVMSKAGPGEVVITSTVRDMMSGSDLAFDDRGLQELKGVAAQWRLFTVKPKVRPAGQAEAMTVPAEVEARRRTSFRLVMAGAGVALVGAAVGIVLATRDGGQSQFVPAPNTVVRIDPQSGDVVGGVTVGTTPMSVAFGHGTVWVANFDARTIQRIDPKTNQAGPAFGGLKTNPTGLAVGGGFAWVTSSISGTVWKIDPSTNLVQPIDFGVGVKGVAYGESSTVSAVGLTPGAVWVTNSVKGTVLRIDPRITPTAPAVDTIDFRVGSGPGGIAVGAGSVWVADTTGSKVFEVDISTNDVVGRGIRIPRGHPEQVAFGEGYVWVTNTLDDSVTRIDPETDEPRRIPRVGDGPTGVAAGAGAAWVTNSLDGTVSQIDPETAKVVRRITVGFSPNAVVVGAGSVWVALRSS
jgi:YVTN family beta-propeller protein